MRNWPTRVKFAALILLITALGLMLVEPRAAAILGCVGLVIWAILVVLHWIIVLDGEREYND